MLFSVSLPAPYNGLSADATTPVGRVVSSPKTIYIHTQMDTDCLALFGFSPGNFLQVFQSDGSFVGKMGGVGSRPGCLEHPSYIAVSSTNRVIVSDTNNHRVQVFDVNGRCQFTFGMEGSEDGSFRFPRGVAVDDQGYIVVADSGNNRIQVFQVRYYIPLYDIILYYIVLYCIIAGRDVHQGVRNVGIGRRKVQRPGRPRSQQQRRHRCL